MSDSVIRQSLSPYAPDDWGWLRDEPPSSKRYGRTIELSRRQQEQLVDSLARRRGTVKVVLYTMALPGVDVGHALEEARVHALEQGWLITGTFSDNCTGDASKCRPGWAAASSAVARGFAHGVLALDRSCLSNDDDVYETILDWLCAHGSFLAHVLSE